MARPMRGLSKSENESRPFISRDHQRTAMFEDLQRLGKEDAERTEARRAIIPSAFAELIASTTLSVHEFRYAGAYSA
jgi:hypothetical protein